MKVLMVTGRHLPLLGGVEVHVDRVSRELVRRGHEVIVQCTTPGDDDYPYRVVRVPAGKAAYVPRVEADIVWHHDFFTYEDGHRGWSKSGKVFVTFHGWEGRFPLDPSVAAQRLHINDDCDGSIGVGLYLEKWYGTTCDAYIWGGIGAEDIGPMDKAEPQRFIWVGGLRDDMNLGDYLELLGALKKGHGSVGDWEPKLDVVGGGHPKVEEALLSQAGELGLDIEMHGWMEDYGELYEKANYVLSGGYLSMLKGLANFKTVVSLWSNDLKRDYVEWFPGRLISAGVRNGKSLAQYDLALQLREGLPPEVMEGNLWWAMSQSWSAVADVYEELWAKALSKG